MKICFRVDASIQIGTGHVMRCLTLADALTRQNAKCQFICRAHEGNLIEIIRRKGYEVHILPIDPDANGLAKGPLAHSQWLGVTQQADAVACLAILNMQKMDWLIVDHYALDAIWEQQLASNYKNLMVIDDLSDRHHICDLLLDQTYGRNEADYKAFVPQNCQLLCGAQYAILRPEFSKLRNYSFLRRYKKPILKDLLINMGGVDKDNITSQILKELKNITLPTDFRITVVMGLNAPWLQHVESMALLMHRPTKVLVGVSDMAQLMADSDLAIGAAGSTTWERCCLGLPTIMISIAKNQEYAASILKKTGATKNIKIKNGKIKGLKKNIYFFIRNRNNLRTMSIKTLKITNGYGCNHCVEIIKNKILIK